MRPRTSGGCLFVDFQGRKRSSDDDANCEGRKLGFGYIPLNNVKNHKFCANL